MCLFSISLDLYLLMASPRNNLLERLSMIRQDKIKTCDSRINQKRKLDEFRVLVDDFLLRLVANQDIKLSDLRFQLSSSVEIQFTFSFFMKLKARINQTKRNEILELIEMLRQISESLLQFREQIGGEIMRIVMLPEQSLNLKLPNSNCDYCQVNLSNLKLMIHTKCALTY